MSGAPSPALARIKRAVRAGVDWCGGVDGAGATAGRSRSVAGDWHNLNHAALPPLDCALALDEVAVARGAAAPILSAYAAELGYVCIALPRAGEPECGITAALVSASAEFGDIAHAVRDATRDGRVNHAERGRIIEQIDEAQASLAVMRAAVTAGGGE